MATQDRSPSLFIGQQWSAWTEIIASLDSKDQGDKEDEKQANDSMKLGRQDMGLFGFCPSRDEFSLVVCEKCNLLVKPQALKEHIESRHGPTNLSSLGSVPASALNSELGKKLLMPLPSKSPSPLPSTPVPTTDRQTTSGGSTLKDRQGSGMFKPASSGRPPTKASLKQVPASVRNIPAPRLGVSMKISPVKSVKSGNRIVTTSSFSSTSSLSTPVVKVEKLPEVVSSKPGASNGELRGEEDQSPSSISRSVTHGESSSKISTLVNGSIKTAVSLSTPSSISLSPSSNASVAVTKSSTNTPVSSRSLTTLVTTSTSKPIMIAPVMTISSSASLTSRPLSSSIKSAKLAKDLKEKKFLPCKDREYDANKHCGVKVSETGKPCTRSLTCKTHALSLRRGVQGRSKTFDDLLKEHKAAKDAQLKAKAGGQAVTTASSNRVLVSPASVSIGSHKQLQASPGVKDGKLMFPVGVVGVPRTSVSTCAVPTTTTFVKPSSNSQVFQRFTWNASLPPAITVKEDPISRPDTSPRLSISSPTHSSASDSKDSRLDQSFLSRHPKPMAVCQFGGRLNDRSCYLFSRKTDFVRAAFLSALERQLNPPPHKKLCVESNLPKESQVVSQSQDPYEFNMVDSSGGAAGAAASASANLVSAAKPVIKPKSKLPSSPVAAPTAISPHLVSGVSLSPAVTLSTLASPSFTTLAGVAAGVSSSSRLVKSRDGRSPALVTASSLPVVSHGNPAKRKRSGSTGVASNLVAVAGSGLGNGAIPSTQAMSVSINSSSLPGGSSQHASGLAGIIASSAISTNQTGSLIAIPSVNLANAGLGHLGAAKVGQQSVGGSSSGAIHKNNNIFKDFNLVVGIDSSSLVNGQYVNITGAQLAELAASQGQTLLLNSFTGSCTSTVSTVTSSATGSTMAASLPLTSRPSKRSRTTSNKSHLQVVNSAAGAKVGGNPLETFKLIPSTNVITSGTLPPNAVLMDSSGLQGAMLAAGGATPTLVAISSSAASSVSLAATPTQVLCTDTTASQLSHASNLVNGVAQSSYDKSGSNSQRHHSSSGSKSHHHHQQPQHQKGQQQSITLGNVLQGSSSSIAMPLPSGSSSQLCPSQAIFKPGGTFSLAKNVGGKLTVQPMSLTFPINVGQQGLAALTSAKPPQQTQQGQQQQQHTLLVATSGGGEDAVAGAATGVRMAGKTELHLQPHIASSSSGNLIS